LQEKLLAVAACGKNKATPWRFLIWHSYFQDECHCVLL